MKYTDYAITKDEKLKVKLLSENLRRILYSSMIFAIAIPLLFLFYLIFPVNPSLRMILYTFFICFEAVCILYFVLSTFAMNRRNFTLIEFTFYSFWLLFLLCSCGVSFITFQLHGDFTVYYLSLAAITMIAMFSSKDAVLYLTMQGIYILATAIYFKASPYQFAGLVLANILFISISRILYGLQATAFEMKQKMLLMSKDAEEDPLTGLFNRRGLDRHLAAIWPYCIRNKNMVAVLVMDIDNFKKYNDTFGHPEGDKCLQQVAAAIQHSARRNTDVVARIGGEEFLVFIHGTSGMEPVKLAEKIRSNIEKLGIPQSPALSNPYVTVSIGVAAVVPTKEGEFETLYNEADKALYYAKKNGRNVIVCGSHIYGQRIKKAE